MWAHGILIEHLKLHKTLPSAREVNASIGQCFGQLTNLIDRFWCVISIYVFFPKMPEFVHDNLSVGLIDCWRRLRHTNKSAIGIRFNVKKSSAKYHTMALQPSFRFIWT